MEGISSFLSPPLLKILIIKFRIYGIGGEGWEYGRHGVYFICECVSMGVAEILLQINYYNYSGGILRGKIFIESQPVVLYKIFAG